MNELEKEQKIIELIVANPDPEIEILRHDEVPHRQNEPLKGDFLVEVRGIIHPASFSEEAEKGYVPDTKIARNTVHKVWWQYGGQSRDEWKKLTEWEAEKL